MAKAEKSAQKSDKPVETEKTEKTEKTEESKSPLRVGNEVFIRTVTMYHTGRIVELTPTDIVLEDAAWIASTGRFANALKNGAFDEVEPFEDPIVVSRGAVIDVTTWKHPLPLVQK
jgi:hypothetical protein